MFIDVEPNRLSPPAVLLHKSVWKNGKAHKRTLANLTEKELMVQNFWSLLQSFTALTKPVGSLRCMPSQRNFNPSSSICLGYG